MYVSLCISIDIFTLERERVRYQIYEFTHRWPPLRITHLAWRQHHHGRCEEIRCCWHSVVRDHGATLQDVHMCILKCIYAHAHTWMTDRKDTEDDWEMWQSANWHIVLVPFCTNMWSCPCDPIQVDSQWAANWGGIRHGIHRGQTHETNLPSELVLQGWSKTPSTSLWPISHCWAQSLSW